MARRSRCTSGTKPSPAQGTAWRFLVLGVTASCLAYLLIYKRPAEEVALSAVTTDAIVHGLPVAGEDPRDDANANLLHSATETERRANSTLMVLAHQEEKQSSSTNTNIQNESSLFPAVEESNRHQDAVSAAVPNEKYGLTEISPLTLRDDISYLTGYMGIGRLGNNMFVYASIMGIALRHNLTVAFVMDSTQLAAYNAMRAIFKLSLEPYEGPFIVDKQILEDGWGRYKTDVNDRSSFLKRSRLTYYLQSYKYFVGHEHTIRKEFKLTDDNALLARTYLLAVGHGRDDVLYIGVHVRRGDMVDDSDYATTPAECILNAMRYYDNKYGREKQLHFVIGTDDVPWAKAALSNYGDSSKVSYSDQTTAGDMAILSQCNHSIITSGTYGWWAGWLAGGDVVYYRDFIPSKSQLASGYAVEDYYPPSWIPMML